MIGYVLTDTRHGLLTRVAIIHDNATAAVRVTEVTVIAPDDGETTVTLNDLATVLKAAITGPWGTPDERAAELAARMQRRRFQRGKPLFPARSQRRTRQER